MRQAIKKLFQSFGYEIRRQDSQGNPILAVGNMQLFLEDLRERGFVPQSILDVGANRGNWSRMVKSVFPAANCFLIEPQVEMKPFLDSFCQDFPGSQWFLAGAGAVPGELTLNVSDNLDGASFLIPQTDELKHTLKERTVQVVTIDSLIEQKKIPIPQLVKLDIQGFEIEALRGGMKIFDHVELFIVEVSLFEFKDKMPIFHEVISFMEERDYLVYNFAGFLQRPYDGALGQVDVCFAKRDGALRGPSGSIPLWKKHPVQQV